MFKFSTLLALLALFCVVNAQGQIVPVAEVPGNVQDLAKWAVAKLSAFTSIDGEYYLLKVRDLKQQVTAGMTYYFTADIVISNNSQKPSTHSCELIVYEQTWTNTREMVGTPKCSPNPSLIA